ncbi:hypothetical protein SDC9_62755 [bioreactor metagenome]|uniref:DUF4288 domain-containing protein n=1 Tax=bioreactor metagenome TaxID=1076179 RepID=A0A644XJK3_9ZZZZ
MSYLHENLASFGPCAVADEAERGQKQPVVALVHCDQLRLTNIESHMTYDKNVSPVGWYLVSYLLRFVELDDKEKNDDNARFLSWENSILVRATTMDEAYEKGVRMAREATKPYKGGPAGVLVQWKLVGVTDVLPIYEELVDGAEIAWTERAPRLLKNLKKMVRPKGSFLQ